MKKNLLQQLEAAGFKKCQACSFVIKEVDLYCRRCGAENRSTEYAPEKDIIHLFDPKDFNQYSTLPLGYEARVTGSLRSSMPAQET
jgi:hypothetical protein